MQAIGNTARVNLEANQMDGSANSFESTEQQNFGSLRGRVALIINAASAIGEATALALSIAGAQIGVVARNRERLELLAGRIEARGGQVLALVADISIEAEILSAIDEIRFNFGRLDILVNNAAMLDSSQLGVVETERWQQIIENNLLGLIYALQAATRVMKLQGWGHIVNVSLMPECAMASGMGVYVATNSGTIAFLEELRQQVSQYGIRVTAVKSSPVAVTELPENIVDPSSCEREHQWFNSSTVLQPVNIATSILYALTQPDHANVNEILIQFTNTDS